MIELFWLAIIVVITLALGRTVLHWFHLVPEDLPREYAYGGALGLGILGYGVFGLTALHWLNGLNAIFLLVLGAMLAWPTIGALPREIFAGIRGLRAPLLVIAGIVLLALYASINLISSFNPPIDLDALVFHLIIPKLQIQQNAFVMRADSVYSYWPSHQELLFQLGLLLSGDILSQLISFWIAALAVFALWACARARLPASTTGLAAVIFYTIPVVDYEASIAYVDLGVALFALLAWFAWMEWQLTSEDRWLWLSAVTAGFTAAVKLSGAFIPALLCLTTLGFKPREKDRFTYPLAYALVAGVIVCPWLIRAWLATGNPVAPYFYDLLPARGWTHDAALRATSLFADFGMGRNMVALVLLPWNVTMYSSDFGGGNIGPIFLASLPILFWARPFPPPIRSALLFSVGYLAIWFAAVQEVRFLMPILPLLSLSIAHALVTWARTTRLARAAVIMLVGFTAVANLLLLLTNFARPPGSIPPTKSLGVIFGRETRADYLRRVLPYYALVELVNELPSSSRVLLLGLGEVYYLNRDFILASPTEQPLFDIHNLSTPDAMAERARALGLTHVVINYARLDPLKISSNAVPNLNEFLRRDSILVSESNGYQLYAVHP